MERNTRSPVGAQQPTPPTPFRPDPTDRPNANPLSPMTGQGKLVFQITTAGGAIPLEGAEIILREFRSKSDGNGGEVVAVLYSGVDGKTEVLTLPAPARSLSLEPSRDGAPVPYALYDAAKEAGYKMSAEEQEAMEHFRKAGGVVYQIGQEEAINITGSDILLFDRKSGRLITAGSLKF